jgi:hypothetical protein
MAIEARCEKCDKKVKVKDALAGKKIKCPGCGAVIAIPAAAAEKQELNPDLNSTESIINLNLKKFKHKEIDPEDEDFDLDQIEGAIANRRRRDMAEKSGPPKEPLEPIDWVLGLLFGGFCCIYPIVLLVKGKRSRGMKTLLLAAGVNVFWIVVQVLFFVALGMAGK